jgi:CHAT domain-containing protein
LTARALHPGENADGSAVRVAVLSVPAQDLKNRANAGAVYAHAQDLSRGPKASDLLQAIAKYKQAGSLWSASGDQEGQILALEGEAQARLDLSQHNKSNAALVSAEAVGAPDPHWKAWLVEFQAQVALDRWDEEPARKYAQDALQLSIDLHDSWLSADARADRAEAEYLTHDPWAVPDLADSLLIARTNHAIRTIARALRCSSWLEKDNGNLTRAFALLEEARGSFHMDGDIRAELQSMYTLADIDSLSGDTYSALVRETQLTSLMQNMGYTAHYAMLLDDTGADYEKLNRIPYAIVYFRRSLQAFESIQHTSGEAIALLDLCSAEGKEKHLHEALKDCRRADELIQQVKDPKRRGWSIWQLGRVERDLGQTKLAIDSFSRSLILSKDAQDIASEAVEAMDMGEALENSNRRAEALKSFEEGLVNAKRSEDKADVLELQYRIADWHANEGDYSEAKHQLAPVLEQIEATRRAVSDSTLQTSYFAAEHKVYELGVQLEMEESGDESLALEMSERGRARGLFEALQARAANGARNQRETQIGLMRANIAVDKVFDERLKLMLDGASKGKLETNAAKLTETIGALERAESAFHAPHDTVSPPTPTMTATEIERANRNSGDTYLDYELGVNRSYLWVIDRGELRSYPLPPRAEIEGMVRKWRAFITSARIATDEQRPQEHARADFQRLAVKLSCVLLGTGKALATPATRLIVVPDGDLAMLPFGALPEVVENGDNCDAAPHGARLVSKHEIVLTPSLSVFLAKKPADVTPFKAEVAIVADPVFNIEDAKEEASRSRGRGHQAAGTESEETSIHLPRLPSTKLEADEIKAIFHEQALKKVRFDASVQTVLDPAMQSYRIWHLATHGFYDETTPEFSGLVFSRFARDLSPVHGFLKAQDIERINVRAELVVLSACNTAAGENISGEGVMGLTYSFLRAGAKQVISTLWTIDDEVTEDLMRKFYETLKRNGYNASDALHQSQLAVMREHRNLPPYYWAAFELFSVEN